MGRISLELVPRSESSFAEELKTVKEKFPRIDALNIPDILKFEVRIPEACEVALPFSFDVIPHIRAVAVNREKPVPFKKMFEKNGIDEILVILGDNPEIVSESENPCTSIELIKKIKKEMPGTRVYAALDQWRTSFEEEMEYVFRKKEAGADGFFTQPFFDIADIETWAGKLKDTEVFWGVAPVIRESSRVYWETKNNIVFPGEFECTMEWNKNFAGEVLKFIEENDSNAYLCPITVDFVEYLEGVV